ncbi:DUF6059 family protein [Streptomyces sp. NPDC060209]|uniref:DUF6059 family protein n=1 Tax=Streptomyces sp. NPDC060209 TaxID=3347073 RepID=UPI0036612AC3
MRPSLALRLLRALCRSLVAYGASYAGVEDPEDGGRQAPGPPPAGSGPGAAHPERVRPDVPLTPTERAHARELGRS